MRAHADDKVIDEIQRRLEGKVDGYEIFISSDTGFSVEVKEGGVDALKARSNAGVGLRTMRAGRPGFGFSSVTSPDAIASLVEKTIAAGCEAGEDVAMLFCSPAPKLPTAPLLLYDPSVGSVSEDEKIASAITVEAACLAFDASVKRVRKASYGESISSTRVVNSNGVDVRHSATYFSASVTAVAERDGDSQMGWDMASSHTRADMDFASVGTGAAKRAVRMLGARKLNTVKCPAVFENTVATELLEALAGSFLGDNVLKGKSMLAGKLGKKTASTAITIVDNGLMPGGWSSALYDDEGVPHRSTVLLDNGVCSAFLYDTYWAVRAGAASTGNGARSSFKGTPGVGLSNIYIEKGQKSFDDLTSLMNTGLLITDVLGMHTVNTVSGDFSIGAAGFWVEAGAIAYPVRGLAISGNLLGLFSRVQGVGADQRFLGSVGAPSLLVEELEVSGA